MKLPASEEPRIKHLAAKTASPVLALTNIRRLTEAGGTKPLESLPTRWLPHLICTLGGSSYLADNLIRHGKDWSRVFLELINVAKKETAHHVAALAALARSTDSAQFFSQLRLYKQREYLRIGSRDLSGLASVEETVRELTCLAEACLESAYRFGRNKLEATHGPMLVPGSKRENRFVVLGMGKLGGAELNFSSDIDVIYLYESEAAETGPRGRQSKLQPGEFFARLAELLTKAMEEVTEEGFVFRTDLRLRPLGRNGPIVQSVASALLYYESWGQCWERSALIKARPVAGDRDLGEDFLKETTPFVYRRYLDFSTVEELREMKLRIEREQLSQPEAKERNVKLGRGGIREIEFFTQAIQLVNGGYERDIRERNTLRALQQLAKRGLVPRREEKVLSDAYRFLRDVEHKIQIFQAAQSHEIPKGAEAETALARRLGYCRKSKVGQEATLFWRDYHKHTKLVHETFERLFYGARKEIVQQGSESETEVWRDLEQEEAVLRELAQHKFNDPRKAYKELLAVRDGAFASPPSARRLKVMRDLMPLLMKEILGSAEPEQALSNMAEFGRRIGVRTGFLSLLVENPKTTQVLIRLFANSQFLSDLFLNRAELLDSLIRVDLTQIRKNSKTMLSELWHSIEEGQGLEERLDRLRRYRVEEFLRIGLHDLGGELSHEQVLRQLSDLAEACLKAALGLAEKEMEVQYGKMRGRFAVIGMGKLGGRELEYNSDLDLIFLYDSPGEGHSHGGHSGKIAAHEYYVKLGQRLITFLSAPTAEGLVYRLDMRLRPSGRSGPLVSSLDAFRRYHEHTAELWERQAMIKARFTAGDSALGAKVARIAERVAYATGLSEDGMREIHHIRMRMERELAQEDRAHFDVKAGRGALIDIEFLTQMLQLCHGHRFPPLRRQATLEALAELKKAGLLSARDYAVLVRGYGFLQRLGHLLRLKTDRAIHTLEREPEKLQGIARALGYKGSDGDAGSRLLKDYENWRDRLRGCYAKHFKLSEEESDKG